MNKKTKKIKDYTDEYVDALHRELSARTEAMRLAHECLEVIRTCSAEKLIVENAETGLAGLKAFVVSAEQT